MNLIKKIKTYFQKTISTSSFIEKKEPLKTVQDLNVFDDVWLIKNNVVLEGWILEKVNYKLVIVYSDEYKKLQEIIISETRPLNKTIIEYKTFKIILNKCELPKN